MILVDLENGKCCLLLGYLIGKGKLDFVGSLGFMVLLMEVDGEKAMCI